MDPHILCRLSDNSGELFVYTFLETSLNHVSRPSALSTQKPGASTAPLMRKTAIMDELYRFASPIVKSDRYTMVGFEAISAFQSAPKIWIPQARSFSKP